MIDSVLISSASSVGLLSASLYVLPIEKPINRIRNKRAIVKQWRIPDKIMPILAIGAGMTAGSIFGLIGIAAGSAIATLLWRQYRLRGQRKKRLIDHSAIADGLATLVLELRAGAHPAIAAQSAADDSQATARTIFIALSSTLRNGGDITAALHRQAYDFPYLSKILTLLAQSWQLSSHYGLALADVLDAARDDIAQQVAFIRRTMAHMAGPRLSATLLAGLPFFGLLLGELSGAHPLTVLATSVTGQILLAIGAGLVCLGLYWSDRITRYGARI